MNSISGQSKPSEKISTFTIMSISPFLKAFIMFSRAFAGVSLSMFSIAIL